MFTDDDTARGLASAAVSALGTNPDPGDTDRIRSEIYLLNRWGHGTELDFSDPYDGPMSDEVYRAVLGFRRDGSVPGTSVPEGDVRRLSGILRRGDVFVCAYRRLMMRRPGTSDAKTVFGAASALGMSLGSTPVLR